MESNDSTTSAKHVLTRSPWAQLGEILLVFATAILIFALGAPLAGENPIARQAVVWVANVVMLLLVWLGLRLRGQSFENFGLATRFAGWKKLLSVLWKSVFVFITAIVGFVVGSIIMANIVGRPEQADFSTYSYLEGNLPMLILALIAVYLVSSFGEEVIYRGFLITRISEMGGRGKWAVRIAVLASAVVFGLVHFDWGPTGIVQTAFMGLALGVSYLVVNRRLWILVLAHVYMDTLLMVQLYLGL